MAGISGEDYSLDGEVEDLSYSDLDAFPEWLECRAGNLRSLLLNHNQIHILPRSINKYVSLLSLDISSNGLTYLAKEVTELQHLRTLTARNNQLDNDALPKDFSAMSSLQSLNLSGNQLTEFPMQLTDVTTLRTLHIGANRIPSIPDEISNLNKLSVLYLGGNKLTSLPESIGRLTELTSLSLCDNRLQGLPASLCTIKTLQSLSLHNNKISTLPPGIVSLHLMELSLRNNPLVVRFVEDLTYQPPTLLELAGRVAKIHRIPYSTEDLPGSLVAYLNNAKCCVNPKCKGVYFSSHVENIRFVDFCGKYRLPLLQYLCTAQCRVSPAVQMSSSSEGSSSESSDESSDEGPMSEAGAAGARSRVRTTDDDSPMADRIKKVLLG